MLGCDRGSACLAGEGREGRGGARAAPQARLTPGCGFTRLTPYHRETALLPLVWDELRGRRGGEGEAQLGRHSATEVADIRPLNQLLEGGTFPGSTSDDKEPPGGGASECAFLKTPQVN